MIFGGYRAGRRAAMLNLTSMAWRDLPDLPSEHGSWAGCGLVTDSKNNHSAVVVAGGVPGSLKATNNVSILYLRNLTWRRGAHAVSA